LARKIRRRGRRKEPWWVDLDYEELLDVKLCDLDLSIEGTALEARVEQLYAELERAELKFRPHVWLSTSWFTPDGVTGFAIPFYLAHRRLARIEHEQMFEVEGGSHSWCMKLLRHETGHALDNAYRLHWRARWRETFGSFSRAYGQTYLPNPTSKRFVQNLDYWYSQSHPAEDWAECFAVWLQPGSRWRRRYAGWPALEKLEYVDRLMSDLPDRPKLVSRKRPDSLPRLRTTLREYYTHKKEQYGLGYAGDYDHFLLRLFTDDPGYAHRPTAAGFLRRNRQELRGHVAGVTGQYRYVVDQALREMIGGCKKLRLRLTRSESETRIGAAILLAVVTARFLGGRRREFQR